MKLIKMSNHHITHRSFWPRDSILRDRRGRLIWCLVMKTGKGIKKRNKVGVSIKNDQIPHECRFHASDNCTGFFDRISGDDELDVLFENTNLHSRSRLVALTILREYRGGYNLQELAAEVRQGRHDNIYPALSDK